MPPVIISLSHGRNEAEYLGACLRSINEQTLKPTLLLYVDDCSTDDSVDIALSETQWVFMLLEPHENWVMSPNLAKIYNTMFNNLAGILSYNKSIPRPDFYFIGGCDAIYPYDYLEKLVAKFDANPKLVIASGVFRDEPCGAKFARGLGRLIKADFWDRYVKQVPVKIDWETEPNRIAWANGFEVASFPDIRFDGRPTGARR
jgi:glycosyltransferase involved in cell wall biosynthesis